MLCHMYRGEQKNNKETVCISKDPKRDGVILLFVFKVLLLTNFKHGPEDDDCPVPDEVKDTLAEFHNDLLLHCGEKFFKDVCKVYFLHV